MKDRRCLYLAALLIAVFSPISIHAQSLEEFKQNHPRARFFNDAQFYQPQSEADEAASYTTIYGTVLANGPTPEASAWNHVNELKPLLGEDIGNFAPAIQFNGETIQGVMFNRDLGKHKFKTFRFEQQKNGMPVFRSGIGFLVRNEADNPLVVSSFNVKELAGHDLGGAIPPAEVTPAMMTNVRELLEGKPVERSVLGRGKRLRINVGEEKVVIYAGIEGAPAEPQKAISFVAKRGSVQTYPDYQKYLFVASVDTGEILLIEGANSVELDPLQGYVVPKGVVHKTRAPTRTVVLMVETASIVPTGDPS